MSIARRRRMVAAGGAALAFAWNGGRLARAAIPAYPDALQQEALRFPRDHGAHPAFRTEWWYATGWLRAAAAGDEIGFQVTFFRSHPPVDDANASRFAPRQLLFAHAAIADPTLGRLLHDQRAARVVDGVATARFSTEDMALALRGWTFARNADGSYAARIAAREFELDLVLAPTQPPLLQGHNGWSQKGPDPRDASRYVSHPQLAASGKVARNGAAIPVTGRAWLDHEWSSRVLGEHAAGWDWIGANLDDGSALMAFRIRAAGQPDAAPPLWAGGTLRRADGSVRAFAPGEVGFTPRRTWRSPRTGAQWPVAMALRTAELEWVIEPIMDDQELDSRASVGAIYWEGAVRLTRGGAAAGSGYLELTGYAGPLRM